MIHMTLDWRC